MKNILHCFTLFYAFSCQPVFAQAPPPVNIQGQSQAAPIRPAWNLKVPYNQATNTGGQQGLIETGNGNLLVNPSFEAITYSTGWTVAGSSGCNSSTSTSFVTQGLKAGNCATSAAVQDVVYQYVTPTVSTAGINQMVSIDASANGSGVQVCSVVNAVEIQCLDIPTDGVMRTYPFYVVVPNSTAFGVKIKQTTASSRSIGFDNGYAGVAREFSQFLAGGQFVGSVSVTGCSTTWDVAMTSVATAFPAVSGCTYSLVSGSGISAPSTNVPGFIIQNARVGRYAVVYTGALLNAGTGSLAPFFLCSGSNASCAGSGNPTSYASAGATMATVYGGNSSIIVPSAAWDYRVASPTTNLALQLYAFNASSTASVYGTSGTYSTFSVYYFPDQSQQAIQPIQSNFGWTTCPSFTTNWVSNTTAVCTWRRDGPNATFNVKISTTGAPTSATLEATLPITINTGGFPATPVQEITVLGSGSTNDGGARSSDVNVVYNSATTVRFLALNNTTGGTAITQAVPFTWANGDSLEATFTVPVSGWIENQSAPLLVNGVASTYEGLLRVEVATSYQTCSSTPCTLNFSTPGITSIARDSQGLYTVTYSAFSAAPSCLVYGNQVVSNYNSYPTTTSFQFATRNSSFTVTDGGFTVQCIGPR